MQLINPCNTIQVIPQDPNTCLFNTIMMAIIYSDELSKCVYKKIKHLINTEITTTEDIDRDNLFKFQIAYFLKSVLSIKRGFIRRQKDLRKSIDRFSQIISSYFNIHYPTLNQRDLNLFFLSSVLKDLGVNVSTIIFIESENKLIKNIEYNFDYQEYTRKENQNIPDVLLLTYSNNLIRIGNVVDPNDIDGFELETMTYYGVRYKKECVLLSNDDYSHTIVGLTCNKSKKYVYNGWKEENELISYDWDWVSTNDPGPLNVDGLSFDFINPEHIHKELKVYVRI